MVCEIASNGGAFRGVVPCALSLFITGTATAGILGDMIPPPPTDGACWERSYDNDHLARHPRQKVTDLRILLQPFRGGYAFNINIATRERAGDVSGSCTDGAAGSASCSVTCGGGEAIVLRAAGDRSIFLDIGAAGGVQVNARCDGDDAGGAFLIEADPDDKVFLLHPTTTRTCTVQPFKPFLDHRGD